MCRSVPLQLRAANAALALLVSLFAVLRPAPAAACGGLFCSGGGGGSTQAGGVVNQTAERILFIHNDDQTISAVIQILYEGPADKFAWIIPIAGVPKVEVSSTSVLDVVQQATNPQYSASIQRICPPPPSSGSCVCCAGSPAMFPSGASAGSGGSAAPMQMPVVTVQASGSIGPYDYAVISVSAGALDPAEVALDWLTKNEFDATETAANALRPYLLEDMNLLAFKLQKSADVGSIRPVMLTYPAEQSSIPIRPTAVAAQEDMSVMVWTLADSQVVPRNYKSVVLNDARVNWFSPGMNYDDVVSAAVDEAGGQAFVTEYASSWNATQSTLYTFDATFLEYRQQLHTDWVEAVQSANRWSTMDGFDEALQAAATLPPELTFDELKMCVMGVTTRGIAIQPCLQEAAGEQFAQVRVDVDKLIAGLEEKVFKPIRDTYVRMQAKSFLTRLYTKISPQEMTLDPVFGENADAPAVANFHSATGTSDCGYSLATINLPLGVQIIASPTGEWPVGEDDTPAALRVLQYGDSGPPAVLIDETATVMGKRFAVSQCAGGISGSGGRGGSSGSGNGGRAGTGSGGTGAGGSGFFGMPNGTPSGMPVGNAVREDNDSDGCRALPGALTSAAATQWLYALLALGVLARRRRG